jgi:molybdate transport system ATP-binding protein
LPGEQAAQAPLASLPLASLIDVTIRANGGCSLSGVHWDIYPGQRWAILGPNGSGKSLLAAALAGRIPVARGTVLHQLREGAVEAHDLRGHHRRRGQVVCVSLADQQGLAAKYAGYHQARWNASEAEAGPTVEALLTRHSVEAINPFEILPEPSDAQAFVARRARAISLLGLAHLLHRPVKQLSNGETRKLLLARALAGGPRLLVLDDPFAGLDVASRADLHRILDQLGRGETTLVIATSRADEIPSCVTHLLALDRCRVFAQGPRATVSSMAMPATPDRPTLPRARRVAGTGAPLVDMRSVTVRYGETTILDGVDFTVRESEHWALLGPNGAGKSTLLSLILADNPQAYANDVRILGRRRGSGESIWDIKARIGWVAPELHLHYPPSMRCLDVVLSGFFASVGLYRETAAAETERARRCLAALALEHTQERTLGELSQGMQRLVLLARAMVRNPRLLILDEPCQGLDSTHTREVNLAVDGTAREGGSSIIYVTHREDDLPSCITHVLRLEEGRVKPEPT